MPFHLLHRDGSNLLGHQSRQAFLDRHSQSADAFVAQSESRGQHQVGPVRLEQIGRTHVGLKAPGNQRHHVHQRFRGLSAFLREVADFFQS